MEKSTAIESVFVVIFWTICCYSTLLIPKLVSLIMCILVRENEKCRSLRQQIKSVVSDLNEISAVNEFAKHARKTRELNRLQDELKASGAGDSVYALKGSLFLQVVLYLALLTAAVLVLRSFFGVAILTLHSSWFYPLNYVMALPDLAVSGTKSPVSCLFVGFLIWYVSRRTRPNDDGRKAKIS